VPAAFGADLILDVDACQPCAFEHLHGAGGLQRAAVACVGVGNRGNAHRRRDVVAHLRHLRQANERMVGQPQQAVGHSRA
jgi:hypothetical protein